MRHLEDIRKNYASGCQTVNTLGNPAGASIGYTNCITSTGTLMVIVPLLILYLFAQKGFVESLSTSGIKM